ncbi:MAG TPA: VWA domain-containing protein [Candidatus Paceibacterota bacterium]|nr:VWA domain-containing protein [Verrucomicrobiota bacterium]HRY50370.1 VWA domain-containing protein [Candidatus Paceibacterota bacterium]HSA00979.1 VWA domain-containing protein [Candidatus Paceibacterota bacterium]
MKTVPVTPGEKSFELAWDATLRKAAILAGSRRRAESRSIPGLQRFFPLPRESWHRKLRCRPCNRLIVLLVDSSESMGSGLEARMKAAKGAALGILRRAYQNRNQAALIAFGGDRAKVVLSPTTSIDRARHQLERLPTGGATPFADGLYQAWQLIRQARQRHPGLRPILLILSDGEANVPLVAGAPIQGELLDLAERVRRDRIACILINVQEPTATGIDMVRLADALGGPCVEIRDLSARRILAVYARFGDSRSFRGNKGVGVPIR